MSRRMLGLAVAAGFALTPTLAQAETCTSLRQEMASNNARFFGIAATYPKTHAGIVGCIVSNDTDSDRSSCAAAVILAACIGLGAEQCTDLGQRWVEAGSAYLAIANRLRQLRCN